MPAENLSRPGPRDARCSAVANAAMVSKDDAHAHRRSHCSSYGSAHPALQKTRSSQTAQEPAFNSLSLIRDFYREQKFSEQSIDIICSSWRESTKLQYIIYFKKWVHFCSQRKIDSLQYNEVNCVHFLTALFDEGKCYSALNTARSALSTFLSNDSGLTIGNSPSVKRFMKGVFELKPPVPRYKFIWDVSIVLNFLSSYFPNEDIPLSVLTFKCVMLLALASMQRVQTLKAIEVPNIVFMDDLVMIPIYKLLKQSNLKNYKFVIKLKYYTENVKICPSLTLKHYIERTNLLRGESKQLFISFLKPYKPVCQATISRWIKTVMIEAGINTSYFKAHSTRAAASSSARDNNIPVDEILQIAGWSNATIFKKFYDKVVLDS